MLSVIISSLIFALILSFLVIIHELGHFVAAKWAKIKVEEFGLGYPPRAITLFKKWGTIFSINWVPFGGFVRMEGEDVEIDEAVVAEKIDKAEKTAESSKSHKTKAKAAHFALDAEGPFYEKSAVARLIVILAGATVNFVFGIIAFAIFFTIVGIPNGAVIESVVAGSPAQQAGLQPETAIVGFIDQGKKVTTRSSAEIIAFVESHRGQNVEVETVTPCQNSNCTTETKTLSVYVRTKEETPAEQGSLGIRFNREYTRFYPWYEMPIRGALFGTWQALGLSVLILYALKDLVVNLVTQAVVPQDLAGPIGIVHQAHSSHIFDGGVLALLSFAGMLSVNLAVMNVLPIPALDGGRALFIILEKIVGKRIVSKFENVANYAGFIFLIGLILIISARDIFRIFVQ